MASSVVLLVTSLAALARADISPEPDGKIVGGQQVDIKKVPWTAAIRKFNRDIQCGGTIISEHWLLSAAHCFFGLEAADLSVRVGSSNHASGGKEHKVEQLIKHDDFHGCQNDIAALKTKTPIVFNESVARAGLPKPGSPPPALNSKLLVSGWGRTTNARYTQNLMAVEVTVVAFSGCQKQPKLDPEESVQICAGVGGKDSCEGDSGGPMVDGNVLVGIVSCGSKKCGQEPGVYTKVVVFRDWIKKNTGV